MSAKSPIPASTGPETPSPKAAPPRRQRADLARGTAFALFIAVGALTFGGMYLNSVWQRGLRREQFLPQLINRSVHAPADGKTHALAAARHIQANNYAQAAELLQRAIGAGETDAPIWQSWAACEAAQGKRKEARAVLLLGQSKAPHAAAALKNVEARVAKLPADAPDSAAAAELAPGGANALLEIYAPKTFLTPLITAEGRRTPWNSGFATRESWIAEEPKSALANALWADALRRNDRLREGEKFAIKAVELDSKSPDAHFGYAEVLRQGGLLGRAGVEYRATLQLRPDWVPALIGLGTVAVEKQLIGVAMECFESAVKLAPEDPDVWIGLGRAYANQKLRHDRSLASFATAARLAPERTDFYPYYSDALRFNFRNKEAESLLRRRLEDAPDDARSMFLLAAVLLDNERTPPREQEGQELLRKSLALDDRALIVRLRLAQLLLEQNKPAEIIPILEQGHRDFPRDVQTMTLLARAYKRTGRTAEGETAEAEATRLAKYGTQVQAAEDAERSNPSDPEVHRRLADVYRKGGEEDKARRQEEILYYLERYPDAAKRGLEALQRGTASVVPAGAPNESPSGTKPQ